jgi:hypothetical protein
MKGFDLGVDVKLIKGQLRIEMTPSIEAFALGRGNILFIFNF